MPVHLLDFETIDLSNDEEVASKEEKEEDAKPDKN